MKCQQEIEMPKKNTEKSYVFVLIAIILLLLSILPESENENTEIPQWGIYVYMAGDNSLSDAVDDDLAEMMNVGSNDKVEIITLVDQDDDDDSAIYRVLEGRLEEYNLQDINSTWYNEINMGNGETLRDFMKWSTTNFPAENTILIIWNHGVGWKSVADDNTKNDYLTMNEIKDSFEGGSVDLIAFDACSMSMFEVAYELRNNAKYILGSEEYEPLNGWTYDQIIPKIMDSSGPEDAAKNIIDAYVEGLPIPFSSSSFIKLASVNLGGGFVKCCSGEIDFKTRSSPSLISGGIIDSFSSS